jgi:DNA-binding CsgD family transcriptional regulator
MPYTLWDAGLELHPFAAIKIDRRRCILKANTKAKGLWPRRSDLFHVNQGRVDLVEHDAQRLFSQRLAATSTGAGQFAIGIADTLKDAMHWLVVRPFPIDRATTSSASPHTPDEPTFLVSFRLADDFARLIDPERLMTDLGLTRTEAKVSAALAEGCSVRDFADREGAQTTTVRWHLENARRKLGCASQRDLVRTILLVSM